MRIVPAVDVMGGRVVRLLRGDPARATVYGGDPAAFAERWASEGADAVHIVDLDAALGRGSNREAVREAARRCGAPVQVAGGLRTAADVREALSFAERAVVGTMAFSDRAALLAARDEHGPGRIVVAADHSGGQIVAEGWRSGTGVALADGVAGLAADGLPDVLLTDVSRDGAMSGPGLGGLREAAAVPGASVTASGGISSEGDVRAVRACGAAAAVLGRAVYEGGLTVRGARAAAGAC